MAMLNALKAGTYSVIRITRFSKHDKEMNFTVDIYTDSTKAKLLTSVDKTILNPELDEVLADRGISDAPASPVYGDEHLVGESPVNGFSSFSIGEKVRWTQDGALDGNGDPIDGWVVVGSLSDATIYYVTSEDKYLKINDGAWFELSNYFGSTRWDTYFDSAVLDQAGKSLLTCIYDFLKTTPEFINTVDA